MTRALLGVGLAIIAYWLFLFVTQRSIVFPAPPLAQAPPPPPDAIELWLQTPVGRTESWLLPPLHPTKRPAPLIIFAHGNGELINHWPTAFAEPRRWGMAVLLVEYPGYGRSGGRPSSRSIQTVFEAAFDSAVSRTDIDPGRIVLYGRSLGGGAIATLSQARPAAALILESSFTSTGALALRLLAPPILVRDRFDNVTAVKAFPGPILVLHGDHDEVIPTRFGRRLAAAAGVPLVLMPCGHNDCPRPWAAIRHFLLRNHIIADSAGHAT